MGQDYRIESSDGSAHGSEVEIVSKIRFTYLFCHSPARQQKELSFSRARIRHGKNWPAGGYIEDIHPLGLKFWSRIFEPEHNVSVEVKIKSMKPKYSLAQNGNSLRLDALCETPSLQSINLSSFAKNIGVGN